MPYDSFESLHLKKLKNMLLSAQTERLNEDLGRASIEPKIKPSGFVLNVPVTSKSESQGSGS